MHTGIISVRRSVRGQRESHTISARTGPWNFARRFSLPREYWGRVRRISKSSCRAISCCRTCEVLSAVRPEAAFCWKIPRGWRNFYANAMRWIRRTGTALRSWRRKELPVTICRIRCRKIVDIPICQEALLLDLEPTVGQMLHHPSQGIPKSEQRTRTARRFRRSILLSGGTAQLECREAVSLEQSYGNFGLVRSCNILWRKVIRKFHGTPSADAPVLPAPLGKVQPNMTNLVTLQIAGAAGFGAASAANLW